MATLASADIAMVLIGGFDLTGADVRELNWEVEALLDRIDGSGDGFEAYAFTNQKRGSGGQKGIFDDAAAHSHALLTANLGTAPIVLIGRNTIGGICWGFPAARQVNYRRLMQLGTLHKAEADYQFSGGADTQARVLNNKTSRASPSGNTDTTSVNNLGQSTAGGRAYLQVIALSLGGYTSVTIRVRDSADNVTFANLGSAFANVTAVNTAQTLDIAGTIRQYTSMSWLFNGAGSGTITPVVALQRF